MNTDRFTIDTDGGIFIQHPFAANMTVPQMFEGAIRQQARDLEQLRADLAAAVAERDEWCRRAKLSEAKEALAEARLAAIDGAPTVATVCVVPSTQRVYVSADVEQYELPPIGTHLIARPAKD